MPAQKTDAPVIVERIDMNEIVVRLTGVTGLYCNRMSAKVKRQLLVPRRKTAADRATLPHDPRAEFLDSMDVREGWHEHSHIALPSVVVKKAMMTAALTVSGVTKADVMRLIFMPDELVPVFGTPRLRMDVTRLNTMGNPPDVRSRAYFREWGTEVRVRYARPRMTESSVMALLFNAGVVSGIGDFRQEKGAGNYGTFEPLPWTGSSQATFAPDLLDRGAQWKAIQAVEPDTDETASLLAEFDAESSRRAA